MQISFTVLLVGLDGAGKSTIVAALQDDHGQVHPTAGFKVAQLTLSTIPNPVLCYDCSGSGPQRSNWWTFYSYADVVCFVVDSLDFGRVSVARDKLLQLADDLILKSRRVPICIMLNKHDKSKVSKQLYLRGLQVDRLKQSFRQVYVKETSGFLKEGLTECFEWMHKATRRL